VLARELSLDELRSIRKETNMELEIFVHGALCVSASGLCLFSSYLGGKSANRGMCTQACRRLYHPGEKGEVAPLGKGGYFFSPADLQLLEYVPDIVGTGINALKIEGRMKSADYVGAVVSAYRMVLDAISEGNDEGIRRSIAEGQRILQGDFARSKTTFLFNATKSGHAVNWLNPSQDGGTGISLGVIQKTQGKGEDRRGLITGAEIMPAAGDSIRLHRADDSERVSHKLPYAAEADGDSSAGSFWLSIPEGFGKGDRVYLIQTKAMSKRHKPVIAPNSKKGGRGPGHEKAPIPAITVQGTAKQKNKTAIFPDGLYVAVSRINDLYVVQSSRPAKVILSLNRKTLNYLLKEGSPPLPFRPAEIILALEPFFPQTAEEELNDIIDPLIDKGYRQFVVNNLGHFSLFRDVRTKVQLIAGPWLYTFNTWALSYIVSLGVEGVIPPLENNRQNLERTIGTDSRQLRSIIFVPVFAWPPLFRMRADLGRLYDFKAFSDNRDENFSLLCESDGSQIIPENPFSITDKIPFLKEAGFRHFVIDLSGPPLKKGNYKDLMRAVDNGTPLPRITRFNWKNGFYQKEE
jgi:putative protease